MLLSQVYIWVLLTAVILSGGLLSVGFLLGLKRGKNSSRPAAPKPDLSNSFKHYNTASTRRDTPIMHIPGTEVHLQHTKDFIIEPRHRTPDRVRTVEIQPRYKVVNN